MVIFNRDIKRDDLIVILIVLVGIIVGGYAITEAIYNQLITDTLKNPVVKVNQEKWLAHINKKEEPAKSPQRVVNITYKEWKYISENILDRVYFEWERSDYARQTIGEYIGKGEYYFNETLERLNKEGMDKEWCDGCVDIFGKMSEEQIDKTNFDFDCKPHLIIKGQSKTLCGKGKVK